MIILVILIWRIFLAETPIDYYINRYSKDIKGDGAGVIAKMKAMKAMKEVKTESMDVTAVSKNADCGNKGCLKTLLFIDDNFLILETIRQLLEKTPYELLLKNDPFDVFLLW